MSHLRRLKSAILRAERKADPPRRRVDERRQFNQMRRHVLRGGDAGDRCSICYDPFDEIKADEGREVVTTPCGHRFCDECLRDAVARMGCMCPLCKKTTDMQRFARARGWTCGAVAAGDDFVWVQTEAYTYSTYPTVIRQVVRACNALAHEGFAVEHVLLQTESRIGQLLDETRAHIYYREGGVGRAIGCEYLGRVDADRLPRTLQERMNAILAELPEGTRVLNVNRDGGSGRWALFYETPACASDWGCDLDEVGGCCGGRELPARGDELVLAPNRGR